MYVQKKKTSLQIQTKSPIDLKTAVLIQKYEKCYRVVPFILIQRDASTVIIILNFLSSIHLACSTLFQR